MKIVEKQARSLRILGCTFAALLLVLCCSGCAAPQESKPEAGTDLAVQDTPKDGSNVVQPQVKGEGEQGSQDSEATGSSGSSGATKKELPNINIVKDFRSEFDHGEKGAQYQKFIMIHDTEGGGSPQSVVSYWAGNGNLVASQFVIGKDGTIVQCVPMDKIAHHAGYGQAGQNKKYGITEDGRDDMKGTKSVGSSLPDYGMNAWSIGIELVHSGSSGEGYPAAQLEALDNLIAYIDAYYGFESQIIDHKSWRAGNSDTSKEFAQYMQNYQSKRKHA